MTGAPGAAQVGGSWGLGTGDTPTWPGASSGVWPAERKTEERQEPELEPKPSQPQPGSPELSARLPLT